jgi:hypothetical protein
MRFSILRSRFGAVSDICVGQAALMFRAAWAEALARSSSAARCSSLGWIACRNLSIGSPAISSLSSPHIRAN